MLLDGHPAAAAVQDADEMCALHLALILHQDDIAEIIGLKLQNTAEIAADVELKRKQTLAEEAVHLARTAQSQLLHWCRYPSDVAVVEKLLIDGADVNSDAAGVYPLIALVMNCRNMPLNASACLIFDLFVSVGINVNICDSNLNVPLHFANLGWSTRLLEAGADVNARNEHGISKLDIVRSHNACDSNMKVWFELLAKHGAFDAEPLLGAVLMGDIDRVEDLLVRNENPNDVLLRLSSESSGIYKRYFYYISTKPQKSMQISAGYSLIICSIVLGRIDILRTLIKAGADVNLCDPTSGFSPLFIAAALGLLDCVEVLLEAGADANFMHSPTGHTVLYCATELNHADCVLALLKGGADINFCNPHSGYSALFCAAALNRAGSLHVLIEGGADLNLMHHFVECSGERSHVCTIIPGTSIHVHPPMSSINFYLNNDYSYDTIAFHGIKYAIQIARIFANDSVVAALYRGGATNHPLPESVDLHPNPMTNCDATNQTCVPYRIYGEGVHVSHRHVFRRCDDMSGVEHCFCDEDDSSFRNGCHRNKMHGVSWCP
jgi:ankyrin repeat protein